MEKVTQIIPKQEESPVPTEARKEVRLRIVSKPEQHLAILLQRLDLLLPNKPKSI